MSISYDGAVYLGTRVSNCWRLLPPPAGPTCADVVPPKSATEIRVNSGETATLQITAHEPPEELIFAIWTSLPDDLVEEGTLESDLESPISFDLDPGHYVAAAFGKWPGEGDASFMFRIAVQ